MDSPRNGVIDFELAQRLRGEIKEIIIARAKLRGMLTYSELAESVTVTRIGPRDKLLFQMLDQISAEEDAVGRGMLSCIVVHKIGDMEPGIGFYELAERLGRKQRNKLVFWVSELHRVHAAWGRQEEFAQVKLQRQA